MKNFLKVNLIGLLSLTLLSSFANSDPCSNYCKQFNKLPNSEYDSYQYEEDRIRATKERCKNAPRGFYMLKEGDAVLCAKCDWYGGRLLFRTTNFCKPSSNKSDIIKEFNSENVASNANKVGKNHEKGSIWKGQVRGKNTGRYYDGDDYAESYSKKSNVDPYDDTRRNRSDSVETVEVY